MKVTVAVTRVTYYEVSMPDTDDPLDALDIFREEDEADQVTLNMEVVNVDRK